MKTINILIHDSCMLHVQLPLILGIIFGTILYLNIYRVGDRLAEQFIEIKKRRVDNTITNGPSIMKVVEVDDLSAIGHKLQTPRPLKYKHEMIKTIQTPVLTASTPESKKNQSHCQYMKTRFKNEFPAVVEFPLAEDCDRWYSFANEVKHCMVEYLRSNGNVWNRLRRVNQCCSIGLYDLISVTQLTNATDTKFLVFPSTPALPCSALSIGLTPDLATVRQLREVLPQCEQHAAETDTEVGKKFENIGEVHYLTLNPHAKASTTGDNDQEVKSDKETTLTDFLQSYIKESEIDYLFVRAKDGVEYYVLRWLMKQKNKKYDRVPICFVTIDLQGPPEQFGLAESTFDKLMINFLEQSDFLMLHGAPIKGNRYNQRIFIFNAYEPFCVEKYFGQWCKNPGEK